jgi:hypothetical protein
VIMIDPRESVVSDLDLTELDVTDRELTDVSDLAVDAIVVHALVVDALAVDALAVELNDLEPGQDLRPDLGPERPRHLRIAPDSVRRRRHVRIAAAAAAVSISATLFAVVGFNVELAQHQIQLQKLQVQLQAQQAKYYDLRAEVAQRSSPAQIAHEAAKRGLVTASPTYLAVPIKPPAQDPAGDSVLGDTKQRTGSSLDPVQ